MQNTPLYIISSSDQGVPIPNTEYDFIIDLDQFDNFEVAKVKVGKEEIVVEEAFVIGIINDDALAMCLTTHIDEVFSSVAEVGLFCELISIQDGGGCDRIVTCKVITKASIKSMERVSGKNYAEVALITELPPSPDTKSIAELKSIFHTIVPSLDMISDRLRSKIMISDNIIYISNLIVDALCNEDDHKFNYIQSRDPLFNIAFAINLLLANVQIDSQEQESFKTLFDQLRNRISDKQIEIKEEEPDYKESIRRLDIPEDSKQKIISEYERMQQLPPSSLEYHTVKDYLAWVDSVPWSVFSNKKPDLKNFVSTLNETHYGLDSVKEHILEYFAIESITNNPQGTVLCFLGEPGTGKTSIAKQIAVSCNREIIKIAVGGMSDEAEIRGHRRTYVASRPGRIVAGLKSAKTMDPLILLDEVDKMDSTRGDPLSALLELLDPEQNSEFVDRYLEIPIDLSKALFIATANYIENIPPPLKDRMEIVHFRNYTTEEKKVIIKDYILPSARKDYNLLNYDIHIDPEVIDELAEKYEIREIKRRVMKFMRQAITDILVRSCISVYVDLDYINKTKKEDKAKKAIGFL